MSSALHKRLGRLEALLAARVAPPIWKWSYGDTDAELKRMVASGEVAKRDLGRVTLWRWLTQEEAIARGMEQPPDPPQPYTPPQLPAPEERKLLAAPSTASSEAPTTVEQGSGAPLFDPDYERVRAVPPQPRKPEDKFHWPIIYPRVGEGA